MTQAISLADILRRNGHEIAQVIIGKSPQRQIPAFFLDNIEAPVTLVESPNFVTDKDHKSVKPVKSIVYALSRYRRYRNSIRQIHKLVQNSQADALINFYDFLGGFYHFFHRPRIKSFAIAHQFLMAHPEFTFPQGRKLDRLSLLIGNKIAAYGSHKILALSFQHFEDVPGKKIYVTPPLLRKKIGALQVSEKGHLLVYMVNPGYGKEVETFHQQYPEWPIHCFWDHKDYPKEWQADPTLTFHQLDDQKFLDKMSSCKGYVPTAGFESVCEAMYLGKPVMMIPVEGHYEQACNAIDAAKAGAGIHHHEFDISRLVAYLPKYQNVSGWFKEWVHQNEAILIQHLTS
jgi:uncharacterized protein (TIGR00661 family)